MASFDPNTPLDDLELNFIGKQLACHEFIKLSQSFCIGTPLQDLARQYKENADASREMLNTWHSNQVPAKERSLMVRALNESSLGILAGTVLFVDQHHATGNAVASNLNTGMASCDPNTPLDDNELKFISQQLDPWEFISLSQSLYIGTPLQDLIGQYYENADAPREMLNTWHFNQDPVKERMLMIKALKESLQDELAEIVRMGECRRTVPQGMSTDLHHATGNAVASNLNMGMASFDPNTPLDAQELDHISDHLNYHKFISLSQSLCMGTPSEDLARQYMENANAPREMLNTWHNNQDQAKERRLMVKALNESRLCSLADTVLFGEWWSTDILDFSDFDNDNLVLDEVEPLCLTDERWCTNILGESWPTVPLSRDPFQPSSAPRPSRLSKQTQTQPLAGHETNTTEPVNYHQHPTHPAPSYEPIAHLPQQPDILPMRIPQQTSYEIMLRDVSNKLGNEWRMVGTYLGFINSQIQVMLEQYRDIQECIFQMLVQWRNTNGVKATKKKLKEALRRSNREDLVDFIDEQMIES